MKNRIDLAPLMKSQPVRGIVESTGWITGPLRLSLQYDVKGTAFYTCCICMLEI